MVENPGTTHSKVLIKRSKKVKDWLTKFNGDIVNTGLDIPTWQGKEQVAYYLTEIQ